MGAGSQFGEARPSDEVVMKIAVKHPDAKAVGIFLKELAGLGLATPPGLSGFTGGGRAEGDIQTHQDYIPPNDQKFAQGIFVPEEISDATIKVPLIKLALARSGDKGNKANIGVIAREPEYLPFIWTALTEEKINIIFNHFIDDSNSVERFYMPGSHAMNILIDNILGGGGAASLRNDAQAKGYSQILLAQMIPVSKTIAESL